MTTNRRVRTPPTSPTSGVSRAIAGRVTRERKPKETEGSRIISLGDADTIVSGLMRDTKPIIDMFREGTHLHVSDVIHQCLRKIALVKKMGSRPAGKRLRDSEVITFRQGDAIHEYVRQRFVDNHSDKVYGQWMCACRRTTTPPLLHSQLGDKHDCPHCGIRPYRYVELGISDDEYGLIGSPDLLLYLAQFRAFHVTEIKSISGKGFAELTRALPDHVIQVVFYWHLMKRAGHTLTDKVSIFYVNKEWSFKNPFQEFMIDAAAAEKRLLPYIEDLQDLNAYVGGDAARIPVRTCAKIDAPDAKDCPVRVTCFQ